MSTTGQYPLPPTVRKFGALDTLDIGQSADFPVALAINLYAAINARQNSGNKTRRFTRRTIDGVIRVWRIA